MNPRAFVLLFIILWFGSCTERQEPPIHPEGWYEEGTGGLHVEKITGSGIESCQKCHGKNYSGGTSGVACNTCHSGGSSGHPDSFAWLNPDSAAYHGRIFWENGWDFKPCQSCHGEDFAGGVVGYSCNTCHTEGIGACYTCHGDKDSKNSYPPKDIRNRSDSSLITVGAHAAHMESQLAVVTCDQCHVVSSDYRDEGHLGSDNIAEITFGDLATQNGVLSSQWDRSSATCSEVYCHQSVQPKWTQVDGTYSACGTCHSLPPAGGAHVSHVEGLGLDCSTCHDGYSRESQTVNRQTHINGAADIELDQAYGGTYEAVTNTCSGTRCHGAANTTPGWYSSTELTCTGCHGGLGDESGAPPVDLSGNSDPTTAAVGAHEVHLNGAEFSDGVACNECHVVPDSILAPGHFDTDLIAEITFGDLAADTTDSSSGAPTWDRSTATCANIYCHGTFAFAKARSDNVWAYTGNYISGKDTTVVWNKPGSVTCGTCHDLPPGGHLQSTSCGTCHGSVIDSDNVTIKDKSKHINGQIDYP